MSRFLLIVGPSGSGKTSVCDMMKPYGKSQIASYTTRKPRYAGEDSHTFVDSYSDWKFNNPDDDIVGFTFFDGNYYWATSSQVEENDLYVIDMAGVEYFQKNYTGHKDVRIVYIDVSIIERFKRMSKRGDSKWSVIKRIIGDLYRFRRAKQKADFIVRNDSIWRCRDQILEYMDTI